MNMRTRRLLPMQGWTKKRGRELFRGRRAFGNCMIIMRVVFLITKKGGILGRHQPSCIITCMPMDLPQAEPRRICAIVQAIQAIRSVPFELALPSHP